MRSITELWWRSGVWFLVFSYEGLIRRAHVSVVGWEVVDLQTADVAASWDLQRSLYF